MSTFKGFSTINKRKPPFLVHDKELIKCDLLNHFMTRKGERLMRANYGCSIHDLLMNPLDDITVEQITEEAKRIIDSEPRVSLVFMNVIDAEHTIRLEIELFYKTEDITESMYVDFPKLQD